MILRLYRWLLHLSGPALALHLRRRQQRGKEDATRLGERFGLASQPRPPGKLVWIHCASVGESLAMLPVVTRLQARPGWTVLVTTGTVTSAQLMAARLPVGALHHFIPLDHPVWVTRFLEHWRPDLALWTESEFWPNLLTQTAQRAVPMVLVNGRISPRSFGRWRRLPQTARHVLGGFSLCLGQTAGDTERLQHLGIADSRFLGNLKNAAPPLPHDPAALEGLRHHIGARPCWLLASSHPGEEAMAARLHQILVATIPDLLTVIVPRHPERGPAIAAELRSLGLSVAQRSAGEPITAQTALYLADSLGETGLFYRLVPLVVMGKSWIAPGGGHNPLEPARLGAAVLVGPLMQNFPEMTPDMAAAGALEPVADEAALTHRLQALLTDSAALTTAGRRAAAYAEAQDDVLGRIEAALRPWLEPSL